MSTEFEKAVSIAEKHISAGTSVYGVLNTDTTGASGTIRKALRFMDIDAEVIRFSIEADNFEQAISKLKKTGLKGLFVEGQQQENPKRFEPNDAAKTTLLADLFCFDTNRCALVLTDILRSLIEPFNEILRHEDVLVFSGGNLDRATLYSILQNYSFPRITLIGADSDWCNKILDEAEYWRTGTSILEYLDVNDWKSTGEYLWESRIILNCNEDFSSDGLPEKVVRFNRPGQAVLDLRCGSGKSTFLSEAEKRGGMIVPADEFRIQLAAHVIKYWTGDSLNLESFKSAHPGDYFEGGTII